MADLSTLLASLNSPGTALAVFLFIALLLFVPEVPESHSELHQA
jgi:hypothetical protein